VKRLLILTFLVFLLPALSWSLATTMEFGVRGGVEEASLLENYSASELYYLRSLPWQKEISPGVRVYMRLDAGVTYLHGDSENGGWVAVGGDVVFSLINGALEFEAGFRPAVMFVDEYGVDDLGGPVQFVSHAGATVNLGDAAINYRFQHISNGGFYKQNPGLNLHMLGVGMRF
jgi:hypothetical protein